MDFLSKQNRDWDYSECQHRSVTFAELVMQLSPQLAVDDMEFEWWDLDDIMRIESYIIYFATTSVRGNFKPRKPGKPPLLSENSGTNPANNKNSYF